MILFTYWSFIYPHRKHPTEFPAQNILCIITGFQSFSHTQLFLINMFIGMCIVHTSTKNMVSQIKYKTKSKGIEFLQKKSFFKFVQSVVVVL